MEMPKKSLVFRFVLSLTCFLPLASPADASCPKPPTTYLQAFYYTPVYYTRTINLIVIHDIEGSYWDGIDWFRTYGSDVSAHYIVDYNGAVTQMVRDNDIAWHVYGYNSNSIGIENAGFAYHNYWTTAQYKALAQLTCYLCERYGVPKSRTHIKGHYELDPVNRVDPGPYFNWTYFMSLVLGGSGSTGTTTTVTKAIKITGDYVNVRGGPSTGYPVTGTVTAGQVYVAIATSSGGSTGLTTGWWKIWYDAGTGWVNGSYAAAISGVTGVKIASGPLNVRTGPGTGYSVAGTAPTGAKYVRAGSASGWTKIWWGGGAYWVNSGFITTFGL